MINTDQPDVEVALLLNYYLHKVFSLPHNIRDLLNGQYEDILNSELSTSVVEAIKCDDNLEEIIIKDVSRSNTHLSWLCTGVASLLHFVQCNWTGPPVSKNIDWIESMRDKALKDLSLHNECNINVKKIEFLYLSKRIFSNTALQLKYKSCIWWLFRANLLHQHILDESSGVIFEESENLILKIKELDILKDSLCELLFNLEAAQFYLYYKRTQNSEKHLECAQSLAGLTLDLQGAMGKRTKYQHVEKAQLYLNVQISKDIIPSIDCKDIPKSLDLNDELRLENIEFSEHKEEIKLGSWEEAIILLNYFQLRLCHPEHKLTYEEIKPYLTKVVENTKNWSLKITSLYHRCLLEHTDKRTVERSMMQAESLQKDYYNTKVSVARRMDLFFASGMKPIWILKQNWAEIMFSLGFIKEASEHFAELGMWEYVINCYITLNLKHKATDIIQQEISKKPTVKLWWLLGDATGDVSHYETAWRLSEEKSSRVQERWGRYYFARKNYTEAIPHLKLSVELNNIQELVWLNLGYAALQTEDWKLAATAYKRYCALEPSNFEAWNNLAKVYIKLGDKPKAWKFLQDAIKCNYDRWEVWDNLMVVSIDLGHFTEVIRCYHRILDLKHSHLDIQVLQILTDAIINDLPDVDSGKSASHLLQKCLELFGRINSITINNPDVLRLYTQLVMLRKTDVDEKKAVQYLQQAYRAATSNPTWIYNEDATLNILTLCSNLAQVYLDCATDVSDIQKRKMLGSAKLSLQSVLRKVEEQEWSNANIIEELTRVKNYFTTINNKVIEINNTLSTKV